MCGYAAGITLHLFCFSGVACHVVGLIEGHHRFGSLLPVIMCVCRSWLLGCIAWLSVLCSSSLLVGGIECAGFGFEDGMVQVLLGGYTRTLLLLCFSWGLLFCHWKFGHLNLDLALAFWH